jgi:hypothetical protein
MAGGAGMGQAGGVPAHAGAAMLAQRAVGVGMAGGAIIASGVPPLLHSPIGGGMHHGQRPGMHGHMAHQQAVGMAGGLAGQQGGAARPVDKSLFIGAYSPEARKARIAK